MLATVASAAGLVVGLARRGPEDGRARPGTAAASGALPDRARVVAPATDVPPPAAADSRTARVATPAGGAGDPGDAPVAGLPPGAASRVPSAGASHAPRRTRAQRLVSAQLDAMVARAREQAPEPADEDVASEAAAGGASEEARLQTAQQVLTGMLEGFAGGPRAGGSRDAAADQP